MNIPNQIARVFLSRMRRFWAATNAPSRQEWGRFSLCFLSPVSADFVRRTEDAERLHADWPQARFVAFHANQSLSTGMTTMRKRVDSGHAR